MDRILINDLSARCVLGVTEEERREKQDVTVNLAITADLSAAGASDRFDDALDYRALKKDVLHHIEGSRYFLLEALAESIAAICLNNKKVAGVKILVEKPAALRFARSVGVEIIRERKE